MSVVLDTTVLIDLLRRDRAARDYVLGLDQPPWASEVTRVEVLQGLRSSERAVANALFAQLEWVPVDEAIASIAGALGRRYRRSHALSLGDLVIAATATYLELPLATSNTRDYPMFPKLRPPY